MKLIPLAALTLTLPLVLSACSSSPSLETQTKLSEYERCLDFQQTRNSWAIDLLQSRTALDRTSSVDNYVKVVESVQKYKFEDLLKECEKYRP